MIELDQVWVLRAEHREKVSKLVSRLRDGTTFAHIVHRMLQGELVVWQTKDGSGLVITEIVSHHNGKELFIYGIAGSGILPKRKAIVSDLKAMAELNDCKFIGAETGRTGWRVFGKELGFIPVSTHWMKEL